MSKPVRYIKPLGPRVLVRIIPDDNLSDGGLVLPQGAKERLHEALYGEVVEVARAEAEDPARDGFGVNVAGVPDGARILFAKEAGTSVPWDDQLRLLETKEVLATVEEIAAESMA